MRDLLRCRRLPSLPSLEMQGPSTQANLAAMHTSSPSPSEYSPYFGRYISLVPEARLVAALVGQPEAYESLLGRLSPDQASYRYAPGKWSIRQVVGHVVDAERVFAYRALCIARGEMASLPSFDENAYADAAQHDTLELRALLDELSMVRKANVLLFRHMDEAAWLRAGTVNQNAISVRGLAYIIAGHAQHHLGILKERYSVVLSG